MKQLFLSECGKYLCRLTQGGGCFEAWTIDGCIHWEDDRRIRTWADQAKFRRPMVYAVGGYSAEMTGQKRGSFTLNLLHCDVTKEIIAGTGNTIIESLDVVFRRKIPPQNTPRWLKNQEAHL